MVPQEGASCAEGACSDDLSSGSGVGGDNVSGAGGSNANGARSVEGVIIGGK